MSKIYLIGPASTSAQLQWNQQLAQNLRVMGHDVQTTQEIIPSLNPIEISCSCLRAAIWCDTLVVNCDDTDVDSAVLVGYAIANEIPVIGYRTGPGDNNVIIPQHVYHLITKRGANYSEIGRAICGILKRLEDDV